MKPPCTRAQPSGRLLVAAGFVLVLLQACGDGGGGKSHVTVSDAESTACNLRNPLLSLRGGNRNGGERRSRSPWTSAIPTGMSSPTLGA